MFPYVADLHDAPTLQVGALVMLVTHAIQEAEDGLTFFTRRSAQLGAQRPCNC